MAQKINHIWQIYIQITADTRLVQESYMKMCSLREIIYSVKLTENKRHLEDIVVGLFIFLYCLGAILVALHRFWQFDAFWLDFGILDETVWHLSRFRLPIIPNLAPPLGKIVWADHFNPSAIFMAPVYWLTQRPEIMLLTQVLFVSLSAWVGYITSKKVIKQSLTRIALVISFLGFVGMQNALYTDIHNIVFAVLPLMLTVQAIFLKRWRLYWIFLIIFLGFQESLAAVGMGLGIYLILRREKFVKVGVATILFCAAYAFVTTNIIIPYFNHSPYNYGPAYPAHLSEWLTNFVLPADLKLKTIVMTLATFGVLPIFSLPVLPLVIEHYLERFVLNYAATRWDLGFHYNALVSPIMFLAALDIIPVLESKPRWKFLLPIWSGITILGVIFLHRFYLHGPLMLATHPVFYEQTERAVFLRSFEAKIPAPGLLMTQNNLAAHFTHRPTVLLNLNIEAIKPDLVVFDARPGQNPNDFFPLTQDQFSELIATLSVHPDYEKTEVTDSQLIFLRKR